MEQDFSPRVHDSKLWSAEQLSHNPAKHPIVSLASSEWFQWNLKPSALFQREQLKYAFEIKYVLKCFAILVAEYLAPCIIQPSVKSEFVIIQRNTITSCNSLTWLQLKRNYFDNSLTQDATETSCLGLDGIVLLNALQLRKPQKQRCCHCNFIY